MMTFVNKKLFTTNELAPKIVVPLATTLPFSKSLMLFVVVSLLGAYFLWSAKGLIRDLRESIMELKETIKELYTDRNDHETRIKVLETRIAVCESCNGHGRFHHRHNDELD